MTSVDSHRITSRSSRDDSHSRSAKRSPPVYSDENRPTSNKRSLKTRDTHRETSPDDDKNAPIRPAKSDTSLKLSAVTGGRYIPPGRLKMMQERITDKSSTEYQMLSWNALKRSINGIINKSNVSNITSIVEELFSENLIRGRGLLAQSIMQAQMFSPVFSQVYACLVAIINTKLPSNGELILNRLVMQFKRSYRRRSKNECVATVKFIAHLVNQEVAHELLALQVLTLLLDNPTDDSIELCIAFLKECGLKLKELSSRAFNAVNETLRNVLHEGKLQTRVLYMVETYLKILKDGFKEHPSVIHELDLVPEKDQITHLVSLEDTLQTHTELNVFRADPDYLENETKYQQLKGVILGEDGESGSSEEGSGGEESSEEDKENDEIIDNTGTNDIQFRRTMYLTLMSSINFEETVHKIMRMKLPDGSEKGVLDMILECACQERSYMKYFGLTAQRLCTIRRPYMESADLMLRESFSTVHRLESNKLRNAARFYAHLLYSDAIPWTALECIHLNEEETSASSRIFIKILFQELAEYMGLLNLNERLNEPLLSPYFSGLFSRENPKHSRFSVNFFTTIGLGGLTEGLREYLKSNSALQQMEVDSDSDSDSSDDEDDDSSDESTSSDSSSEGENSPENQPPEDNRKPTPNESPSPRPENSSDQRVRGNRRPHGYRRAGDWDRPYKDSRGEGKGPNNRERSRSPHEESQFDRAKCSLPDRADIPLEEARQHRSSHSRREKCDISPSKESRVRRRDRSKHSKHSEERSPLKHRHSHRSKRTSPSKERRRDRNKHSISLEAKSEMESKRGPDRRTADAEEEPSPKERSRRGRKHSIREKSSPPGRKKRRDRHVHSTD